MASVTFDHVTKRFGDVIAVNDLTIHIEDKEFLCSLVPRVAARALPYAALQG